MSARVSVMRDGVLVRVRDACTCVWVRVWICGSACTWCGVLSFLNLSSPSQRGHWLYAVLNERYNADWFLRQAGIALQQGSRLASNSFRLWIYAPVDHVQSFPAVLTTGALLKNLDEVEAPQAAGKPEAAVVRYMGSTGDRKSATGASGR